MHKIKKEDLMLMSRHSNMSTKSLKANIEKYSYTSSTDWQKFIGYLLLILGAGFCTAGIVFFFAYNWADLDRFVKIGIIEGLLVATTLLCLLYFKKPIVRNVILTAASAMVGVLFAVFGQIYQTGANAYDFFLAWTVFISIWVIIGRFVPLTLLYLILINTTLILYSEQVAKDWPFSLVCILLFGINIAFTGGTLALKYTKGLVAPNWFIQLLSLASFTYITALMGHEIFEQSQPYLFIALLLYAATIAGALWFARYSKNTFYIALAAFSMIICICSLLINYSGDDEITLFILSLFIVVSVTATVRYLIQTQKKWNHDQ